MIINNLSDETKKLLHYYMSCGLHTEIKKLACIGRKQGNAKFFAELHEKGYLSGEDWVYFEAHGTGIYGSVGRFSYYILYKGTEERLLAELWAIPNNRPKLSDKQAMNGFEKLFSWRKELMNKSNSLEELKHNLKTSIKDWNFLSRIELTDDQFQKARCKLIMIDVVEK